MNEHDPNGKASSDPGAKLDAGKLLAGVLGDFSRALTAVAEVGTFGARKYSRGGWQEVPNGIERYNDAKWRHILKGETEPTDPQSKLLHLAHEAWNVLAELELTLRDIEREYQKLEQSEEFPCRHEWRTLISPKGLSYTRCVRCGTAVI